MNVLPNNWAEVPLSELVMPLSSIDPACTPDTEFTYFDISSVDNETGIAVNPKLVSGQNAPSRARQAVLPGDVLFSTVRPNLRAIAQVPTATNPVASTGFCVLRPANGIDAKYLYFLARSDEFLQQILPLQRGVSYPAVRDGDVLGQRVNVAPTAEQIRIVAKLEELLSDLDAGVAELKAAQKKLGQYRQSLLKAAVEGRLTESWRVARPLTPNPSPSRGEGDKREDGAELLARILVERRRRWEEKQLAKFEEQGKAPPKDWQQKYSEPVKPDISGLPELPDGWVWASLDQILLSLRSGTSETSIRGMTEYPVLKSSAIRGGRIDFESLNYLKETQSRRADNYLEIGDILITRLSGSVEYVGCCATVHDLPMEGLQYPDRIFCGKLSPTFRWLEGLLVYYFQSVYAREKIETAAKSTAGHKRISLSDLYPLAIPLSPSDELKEIILRITEAFGKIYNGNLAVHKSFKQAAAQRKNILKAAFAGQLVPQDPEDEPASVLLERIRAERDSLGTDGTSNRRKRKSYA